MNYVIKILLISISLCLALLLGIKHPIHQGDAPEYDLLGWNIKEGNGFSISENAPFTPSMDREPAYPIFLSVIFFIFGHEYLPVQLAQIFIFILICIFVYFLSREIFDSNIAKYSLRLTAFCPTLISYPAFLYSEILATLLILLAIFSLTMIIKRSSLFWYCIAGIILGVAISCKTIMFPFFILVVVSLIFIKTNTWKKKIVSLLLFTLCCGAIISPWMLRNYSLFHKLAISLRGEKVLWMRAQKIDYTSKEIRKHIIFTLSESLGDIVYPDPNRKRTSEVYLVDSSRSDQYIIELEKKGYNIIQINDILFNEAMSKVKAHPIKYFLQTPLEFIKMLSFIYLPSLNQYDILYRIKHSNIFLKYLVLLFKGLMRLSAYVIIILVFLGLYLKRKEWFKWYFLFLIIVYINSTHSLLFADGRYAVVLIPFYLIFTSISVSHIIKRLKLYNHF